MQKIKTHIHGDPLNTLLVLKKDMKTVDIQESARILSLTKFPFYDMSVLDVFGINACINTEVRRKF